MRRGRVAALGVGRPRRPRGDGRSVYWNKHWRESILAIYEQPKEDLLGRATQFHIRAMWVAAPTDASLGGQCSEMFDGRERAAAERSLAERDARAEIGTDGRSPHAVFWGVRSGGGWSLFLDEDPVVHFNARNQLRRLFFQDQKYAAAGRRLELLGRVRYGGRLQHRRMAIASGRQDQILDQVRSAIARVVGAIGQGALIWGGGVGCDQASAWCGLSSMVAELGDPIQVADTPNA